MSEPVIRVSNVYKDFKLPHERNSSVKGLFTSLFKSKDRGFDVQHALKDISFEVQKGEFFGIVGRNGSGKSTLLKMLAQIYVPTKGNVEVHGRLVPFIELGVGFNPELTGRENVYLNGALLGFSKKQIDEQYDSIVAFAELEEFMDQKLKNYSSGMQVRLAFSVATTTKADILLVDEVLAVGDADFQRKCFDYFKKLKKSDTTVVFVTHDMNAVREYCDRAMLIEKSELAHIGTAAEVATHYTRLFTKEDKRANKGMDTKRWGSGEITYDFAKLTPSVAKPEDDITLTVKATAHKDVENPVFGFMVKDAAYSPIAGTNTTIKRKKIGPMKAGESRTVTWTMPNIFGDGAYYFDIALTHENNVQIFEWWEEAAALTVNRGEHTPYIVTPNIDVTVKK